MIQPNYAPYREENRLEEYLRRFAVFLSGKSGAEPEAEINVEKRKRPKGRSNVHRKGVERLGTQRRRYPRESVCAPESARYSLFEAELRVGVTVGRSLARPRGSRLSFSRTISSASVGLFYVESRSVSNRSMDRSRCRVPPPTARFLEKSTDRVQSIVDRWSISSDCCSVRVAE